MLFIAFMPFYSLQPALMIPFIENHWKRVMTGNNKKILISLHEFLIWEYVTVGKEKHRLIAFLDKPFNRCCAAWTAADMEQYPFHSSRFYHRMRAVSFASWYITLMKRYKTVPGIIVMVASLGLMMIESLPPWISMAVFAAGALLLIWGTRGNFWFAKAAKLFQSGKDPKKAMEYFSKALASGLPDQYAIIAASLLLRDGMNEEGRKALEPITKSSDRKKAAEAKTALSMYYWYSGDLDKAIELCEEAKSEIGDKDRNVHVNLCTYYLRKGSMKDFRRCLKDGLDIQKLDSPALIDFKAISYILDGNYNDAAIFLSALLGKTSPSFADPYVHMAMVYLHYGERRKAVIELEKAAGTRFSKTSIYSRDDIEKLIEGLKDDESVIPIYKAISAEPLTLINGHLPSWEKGERFEGDIIPGTQPLPDLTLPGELPLREEGNDQDVSTELSESDEEWIRRHQ